MTLFDTGHHVAHRWIRVGDAYEVTRKPRGVGIAAVPKIPFAPMEAIPQGGAFAPDYALLEPGEIRSGTYFERGDILVAKITPSFENGKQALTTSLPTDFGLATTEVIPLRPFKEGQDRRFLFFYLLHPDVRYYVAERMEGTTGRQRISENVLLDLPFPEFGPEEQTSIADSLEMIQQLDAVEVRAIIAAQELKRAAMQTVFTRGLRGEGQKETEIGLVPEGWELVPLGSLCVDTDVVDLTSEGQRTIEYVDVSSISRDYLQVETTTGYILNEAPSRARKRIHAGDVIFATVRPTLLRTAVVPDVLDNHVCSTALCVLRRDANKMVDRFIYYLVQRNQFVHQLADIETGASYPAVTDRMVKEQLVPVPPIDEQLSIVSILDAIDRKTDLHRRKRAVLEEMFTALLHKLMTGEIWVGDLVPLGALKEVR